MMQRASKLWHALLDQYAAPARDSQKTEELTSFVARRKAQGGAAPVS